LETAISLVDPSLRPAFASAALMRFLISNRDTATS
jgi:hypothetical protein